MMKEQSLTPQNLLSNSDRHTKTIFRSLELCGGCNIFKYKIIKKFFLMKMKACYFYDNMVYHFLILICLAVKLHRRIVEISFEGAREWFLYRRKNLKSVIIKYQSRLPRLLLDRWRMPWSTGLNLFCIR